MTDANTIGRGAPHPGLSFTGFVFLIAAMMAINALSIDAMLPALDAIAHSVAVPHPNDRQWVIFAYVLGFGAGQIVYGPLSDRYGRRPILIISMILFVLTSLMGAFAQSFDGIVFARASQGVAAAASRVVAVSIVRDCYSGRMMARVMSLAMIVFLTAPILAPSLGQLILLVAPWPWIFIALAIMGAAITLAAILRLPETLHPEDRRAIAPRQLAEAARITLSNRYSLGYMLGGMLMTGSLMSFLGSAQQIYGEVFHRIDWFPAIFAACAAMMAAASFLNSKIVERIGMRKVSHAGVFIFILIALVRLGLSYSPYETVWTFSLLQGLQMACFGVVASNFNAMAMDPVGHIAGTASSIQSFISTIGAALLGAAIGTNFHGTTAPISIGFVLLGLGTLVVVLITERGRLFQGHIVPPVVPKTH